LRRGIIGNEADLARSALDLLQRCIVIALRSDRFDFHLTPPLRTARHAVFTVAGYSAQRHGFLGALL